MHHRLTNTFSLLVLALTPSSPPLLLASHKTVLLQTRRDSTHVDDTSIPSAMLFSFASMVTMPSKCSLDIDLIDLVFTSALVKIAYSKFSGTAVLIHSLFPSRTIGIQLHSMIVLQTFTFHAYLG